MDEVRPSSLIANIQAALVLSSLVSFPLQAQDADNSAQTSATDSAEKQIDEIVVIGRYVGLEVPEMVGRYHLNKDFLSLTPQADGDLTDVLPLLPGVQISDDALDVSELAEIRATPISISGAQPWQTGFFLDGMNYNSRQDPGAYDRNVTSINDVQGHPQAFNLNMALLDSVDVYDNNVPVQYGNFSGGVVDARSASAVVTKSSLRISWRGTQSDWGSYHIIDETPEESAEPTESGDSLKDLIPVFEKSAYTLNARLRLSDSQGLAIDLNQVTSDISEISLRERVLAQRDNMNARLKYSIDDTWFDAVDLSAFYAPYESTNFRKDVLNSGFTVTGGGQGVTLNVDKSFGNVGWTSKLSYVESENSRVAPRRYFIWNQAKGKDWGQLADFNSDVNPVSLEGGYGNLDKLQTTINWRNTLTGNRQFWGLDHSWMAGLDIGRETLQRIRPEDVYYYNSAIQYSTALGATPLNCSGYSEDCVELSYVIPLPELEAQLGGPLDFSIPEHVIAYSNNVLTTPQYFQSRLVYPREDIDVGVTSAGLYVSDEFDWKRLKVYLGLRYDWDDFFRNHNLAPRFQLGWDIRGDRRMMVVAGINRYYDAGLVSYRVREQQEPYFTQYRGVQSSFLQGWQLSSADSDFRTRYEDVRTPYDDEIVMGWKQSTRQFGNYSIKLVKRWKRDQLARAGESVRLDDGYRYAYQDNSGSGESERVSISWSKLLGNHSFWANTSFFDTTTNNPDGYDSVVDDTPTDELVYYEDRLITKADLDRIDANFAKPLIVNFGWTSQWFNWMTTSVSGTYTGDYTAAVQSGFYQTDDVVWTCPECESSRVSVPFYREIDYDARVLVNLASHLTFDVPRIGELGLSANISNLFDQRTYIVQPGGSGIEVGRQVWISVNAGF